MNFIKNRTTQEKRNYKICSRCVMDTSDPWIEFDNDGICNHCKNYFAKRFRSHENKKNYSLEDIFESIKSKKKKDSKYDAAVGISGGVDSSYVVYLAQKAGLKILAIHMDNCWDTPTAIKNINNLISMKNVDYSCEVLDWNNFKNIQKVFLESGLPDIELPTDIAITAVISRIAVKHGISTILSGSNNSSEGILPSAWMYNPKDSLFIESIFRKAKKSSRVFKSIKYGFRDEIKYKFFYKLNTIFPLNAINYDKEEAKKILKKEINWESYGGKHCECTFTKFCQLIYQPKKHGMDYRRAHLSTDICNSRITRHEAINTLKYPAWKDLNVENEISFVANKLGYQISELQEIFNKKPLWYKDYNNNEFLLNNFYNLYRLFKGKPLATSWWG